jgi:hypothetical protein
MAGQTTSAYLSEELASIVASIAKEEARSPSQLLSLGADLFANVSPAARRSITALLSGSAEERAFTFKAIGRGAMVARERGLMARNTRPYQTVSNQDLDDEAGIEAEAVAGSRL